MTSYMGRRISSLVGRFGDGGTLTLKRSSSLYADVDGGLALTVKVAASTGASSISVGQSGARGGLPSGATLTVAGDATEHTLSASAEANRAGTLTLSITPALAQDIAEGDVVTLVETSTTYTFTRMRDEIFSETGRESGRGDSRRYHIAAEGATTEPEVGDLMTDGTNTERVVKVMPLSPGAGNLCWTIYTGEAA